MLKECNCKAKLCWHTVVLNYLTQTKQRWAYLIIQPKGIYNASNGTEHYTKFYKADFFTNRYNGYL